MTVTARALAMITVALCVLAPRVAEACPSCAGSNSGGIGWLFILGAMIFLPFGIAYVVYRVIRSVDNQTTRIGRLP